MNASKTSEEDTMTQPVKVPYTAKAHTPGGREGTRAFARLESGKARYRIVLDAAF